MKAYMIVRDDGSWIEQRRERGATHYEPGTRLPPRLWFREGAAKSWLTTYLKGAHTTHYYTSFEGEGDVAHKIEPVEGRTANRFRIVEVIITQVSA